MDELCELLTVLSEFLKHGCCLLLSTVIQSEQVHGGDAHCLWVVSPSMPWRAPSYPTSQVLTVSETIAKKCKSRLNLFLVKAGKIQASFYLARIKAGP